MKYFIVLGGIGCQVLSTAEKVLKIDSDAHFIYCDTDKNTASKIPADKFCLIPNFSQGFAGNMELGKSVVFMDNISELDRFFEPAGRYQDNIELIFVTSSFGGFGAGAAINMAGYINGVIKQMII